MTGITPTLFLFTLIAVLAIAVVSWSRKPGQVAKREFRP
jgi:hypothetical protein